VSTIRNITSAIAESLVYRGREGQWAYLVHRAAGLGVLAFLALHIFDIFLVAFGPTVFNDFLFLYKGPVARILEVFLLFGLLFHALNGLRIIVQDFFPRLMRYHRSLFYVECVIFTIVFIPAAVSMLYQFFEWWGLVIALLLWALVPLAMLGSYFAPTPLNLNVGGAE
jgi:succinate dehydrogenase / fumarate reductase cytochrome b subunit